jgi:hypothetical protein
LQRGPIGHQPHRQRALRWKDLLEVAGTGRVEVLSNHDRREKLAATNDQTLALQADLLASTVDTGQLARSNRASIGAGTPANTAPELTRPGFSVLGGVESVSLGRCRWSS